MRVAIVLLSAIGDIVHAFPVVSSIRHRYRRARFDWIAHPVPGELARRHPAVDRVFLLERGRSWRGYRDLHARLAGRRYDVVLDLQVYAKASLVTMMLDSPRKIGFDRARARELNWLATNDRLPARPIGNVAEEFLEFADHLAAPRRYEWPIVRTPRERVARSRFLHHHGAQFVALVPGCSRLEKEWEIDRWSRLAEELVGTWGYAVGIVGGRCPREDRIARGIVERSRVAVADLRANDIGRLLWLLDSAALVVGVDTGPYHVAVARNVPSIGLFGATDPLRFGPSQRYRDLVVDAFHGPGEDRRWPRRGRRPGRMAHVPVADVLSAVRRARVRYSRATSGVTTNARARPVSAMASTIQR